jgi:hypothetical protein
MRSLPVVWDPIQNFLNMSHICLYSHQHEILKKLFSDPSLNKTFTRSSIEQSIKEKDTCK